ncbi:hypothetical protein [Ferruginibacter sp. SUN106]|uniref:hypothetical protein n=1 Tax=Ferruginibacter sp. SUN106 TaxID=2978348 RepID=UPI003D36A2C2
MRNKSIILIICLLCFAACHNNTPKKVAKITTPKITGDTLQEFMRKSDSIVLISHIELIISPPNPKTGQIDSSSLLFFKNKLNNKLVTKAKKLSSLEVLMLGNLLDEDVVDDVSYAHCFIPRNTILAYRNSLIYYIDVCFECKGLDVVGFPLTPTMSNIKYNRLQEFFESQGVLE